MYLERDPKSDYAKKKIIEIEKERSKRQIAANKDAEASIIDKRGKGHICRKFSFDVESGIGRCFMDGDREYILKKNNIESLYYKGDKIYPYPPRWIDSISSLEPSTNCDEIQKNMLGPLFLGEPYALFVMAELYENGFCGFNENKENALKLYQIAKKYRIPGAAEKVKSLEEYFIELERLAQIERERREQEERRAREAREREERRVREAEARAREAEALKELQRRKPFEIQCQKDCLVNKYQYDVSCYNACMNHYGF